MDIRIMAWLEVEDPKVSCHGQTGAWPNGERVECGQRKCGGGCLRGWRVGSRCEEVIVRKAPVTSLEKASNSAFSLIGPETLKNWKEDSFSKFCARGPRLVRRRPVDPAWKKGHMSSQLCRWPDQAREQPRSGQTGSYGRR